MLMGSIIKLSFFNKHLLIANAFCLQRGLLCIISLIFIFFYFCAIHMAWVLSLSPLERLKNLFFQHFFFQWESSFEVHSLFVH